MVLTWSVAEVATHLIATGATVFVIRMRKVRLVCAYVRLFFVMFCIIHCVGVNPSLMSTPAPLTHTHLHREVLVSFDVNRFVCTAHQ